MPVCRHRALRCTEAQGAAQRAQRLTKRRHRGTEGGSSGSHMAAMRPSSRAQSIAARRRLQCTCAEPCVRLMQALSEPGLPQHALLTRRQAHGRQSIAQTSQLQDGVALGCGQGAAPVRKQERACTRRFLLGLHEVELSASSLQVRSDACQSSCRAAPGCRQGCVVVQAAPPAGGWQSH